MHPDVLSMAEDGNTVMNIDSPLQSRERREARNLIGFWILGLCNNFAYVIMLSAAHDVLQPHSQGNGSAQIYTTTVEPFTNSSSEHLVPHCNPISTGAILLADIIPSLTIKLFAPFFLHKIVYSVRVIAVVVFSMTSFPVVALTQSLPVILLGVVLASIGSGLGEITYLSFAALFEKNVVSTWSSGTGMAGVAGALSYAGLTAVGVTPRTTILIVIVVPCLMAVSYFLILNHPHKLVFHVHQSSVITQPDDAQSLLSDHQENMTVNPAVAESLNVAAILTITERIRLIKPLLKYMIPLGLVYFAEYFINQALFELIIFENIWLKEEQQYRWYQVIYQIGVLVSRSSVNLFQIRHLWILPILQMLNVLVLMLQVYFHFIPWIWLVFLVILWEGLLGGAGYVNTFYRITQEIPYPNTEFSMGVASVSDSLGIVFAGFLAIPVHNYICKH